MTDCSGHISLYTSFSGKSNMDGTGPATKTLAALGAAAALYFSIDVAAIRYTLLSPAQQREVDSKHKDVESLLQDASGALERSDYELAKRDYERVESIRSSIKSIDPNFKKVEKDFKVFINCIVSLRKMDGSFKDLQQQIVRNDIRKAGYFDEEFRKEQKRMIDYIRSETFARPLRTGTLEVLDRFTVNCLSAELNYKKSFIVTNDSQATANFKQWNAYYDASVQNLGSIRREERS
jgi:hypothetical protein